ncbi:unnamed protein product [Dracunculus medinensis]|uniref:RING-type domain-containing protein n=1 Tax=Dracunculus medinensis TaxID=318479 RepID=A0A0N4U876_DRAME|nr:unnamed protein product [Dracunculus medinensis]
MSSLNGTDDDDNDGYSLICCEICFNSFQPKKRPPKILPCGHNFCEQCLFSLCCHQQYYLLDYVNCPTCRAEFNTSTAFNAPTNYDLCRMLENKQKDTNVTVIHVPEAMPNKKNEINQLQSIISRKSRRPSLKKELTCTDCSRKFSDKNTRKMARYCMRCFNKDDCLRLSCLECCVNRHNGHELASINEIEYAHHRLINELKEMKSKIKIAADQFERNIKEIKPNCTTKENGSHMMKCNKQKFLLECQAELNFAIAILENPETTPLPPTVIRKMRQYQLYNNAKLFKMLNLIEAYFLAMSTSNFSLNGHQPDAIVSISYRTAIDSIIAINAVFGFNTYQYRQIKNCIKILSKDGISNDEKKNAFVDCAKSLKSLINDDIPSQSLLLFIDAFLNIFYQLNQLVSKYPKNMNGIKRNDIWKLIQCSYSELFKCAAKHWRCEEPDRVNLIDDLAFLCCLYSDVCDHATITICMIEAARARAASSNLSQNEWQYQETRLQLIDEHLLECRRIQKLQELSSTYSNDRFKRIRHLWRKISSFFRAFINSYL